MIADETESTTEERYVAVQQWWERHGAKFCAWFSSLSTAQRENVLREASPDMPRQPPAVREASGLRLNATDIILPELTIDGLLGGDGKLLYLFFTRRCIPADRCFLSDIKLLTNIYKRGGLPNFSGEQLKGMDTPFVDPVDPEENVRSLGPNTPKETRDTINGHLESGRLVHAEVWLSLQVRRYSLVNFMVSLIVTFEKANHLLPRPDKESSTSTSTSASASASASASTSSTANNSNVASSDVLDKPVAAVGVDRVQSALSSLAIDTATMNTTTSSTTGATASAAATDESSTSETQSTEGNKKTSNDNSSNSSNAAPVTWVEISPTFEALLRSELDQMEAVEAMSRVEAEKQQKEEAEKEKQSQSQPVKKG